MRKGQLIKQDISTLKPGDSAFCTSAKHFFTVKKISPETIEGITIFGNPCKIHKESVIIVLKVKDMITQEEFTLNSTQQEYVYKCGKGESLLFYTRNNELLKEEEAVVLAKNIRMQSTISSMAVIVDAYAKYVTSQKANGEPAQKFTDWFFDVSI